MNWLYATCIGISLGYGTANSPSIDTLTIGSTTTSYKPGLSNAESSYDIEPTYKIPTCVDRSESCQSNYVAAWTNCIVNSSEIYLANQGYTVDFIPRNLILWCPWIGIVLVVLSTRINAQGCVGTTLTLRILFTILGSIEPAQGFPHFLACLQIGRLTC